MFYGASQVALVVKNLPANAGEARDASSIPGWGRSPKVGHGNPLHCSSLGNPMDRGAWWATASGVSKSWDDLTKQLSVIIFLYKCLRKQVTKHKKMYDKDVCNGVTLSKMCRVWLFFPSCILHVATGFDPRVQKWHVSLPGCISSPL